LSYSRKTMASIHARATLLKWNLRMKAKRDGAGPSRCQWMYPMDYCCGGAAGGGVPAGGGVLAGGGVPGGGLPP